jgi:WD40 repeat protein
VTERDLSTTLGGDRSSDLAGSSETQYFRGVARLGVQVAEALAYAHRQGIVHRDVKPSNLLLDMQGVVWITDFGLVKDDTGAALTETGDLVGTLRYMAPERFQERGDARSDVYSLGVTLYELLTLRPAFDDVQRARVMERVRHEEPARPRKLEPRIPRDLETIVLKALAKEPARRYQAAADLAEDLRRYLADRPVRARRSSAAERVWRWCRRNPAVASLVGAVFVLLLCLSVGSLVAAIRLSRERNAVTAAEADRTEKLYQSLVAQANASRFSRQVGQRFGTLEAVRKAADLVRERDMPAERIGDLRNLAIAALTLPDLRPLQTWQRDLAGSYAWDADDQLQRFARADMDGTISVRRLETDEEVFRLNGWTSQSNVRFSPGGRFLVGWCWPLDRLRVWKLAGAAPQLVLEAAARKYAFYPDGRRLLVNSPGGLLLVCDLEDPRLQPSLLTTQFPRPEFLSVDPAGTRLVVIFATKVHILDAKTGRVLELLPESARAQSAAWHPGGHYLALVCAGHDIHVWDLKRRARMNVLKGCRNGGVILAFSPDGECLLSTGWEGIVRIWDWRLGRNLLQTAGWSNLSFGPRARLVIQDGRRRMTLVELAGGREYRSIVQQSNPGQDMDYGVLAIHPDGRLAAIAMSDHTRLFDLETGDEVACLPPSGFTVAFQGKQALVTNSPNGLLRWPIRVDGTNPTRLHLGSPERLYDGSRFDIDCARNGQVIGQATGDGAFLVRAGHAIKYVGPHADARRVAISPDGKFAATANHDNDTGVMVWDTNTGQLIRRVPVGGMAGALFSPDGQWLAAGGTRGGRLVRVGSWEDGPSFPGELAIAFSADARPVMALSNPGFISLVHLDAGQELARLENPNQDHAGQLVFTPDGCKLVTTTDGSAIHVWDLRRIRQQLAGMGLDWEAPAYPEAPEREATAPGSALRVEVPPPEEKAKRLRAGDPPPWGFKPLVTEADSRLRAADLLARQGKLREAEAEYRRSIALRPDHYQAHHRLAALFVQTGRRQDAVAEHGKALELQPDDPWLWYENAHLHLRIGDDAGYRQLCRRMRQRFGPRENADGVVALAHTIVLAPGAVDDPKVLPQLARFRLAITSSSSSDYVWSVHVLGLAFYRAGEDDRAIKCLEAFLKDHADWDYNVLNWLVLALAHHRRLHHDESRKWLDRARLWIAEKQGGVAGKDGNRTPPGWHWRDWLGVQTLHREAVSLVGNNKPDKPVPAPADAVPGETMR